MSELTRFQMQVHTSDSGTRTITASFLVNVQDTLIEDFESAAHDAFLRRFHAAGHMPVGPILITTETWVPEEQKALTEGRPLLRPIEDFQLEMAGRAGNIVKVMGDVELGLVSVTTPAERRRMPVEGETRNIPSAQRLLREGGICSAFWRLNDGTPVICAMEQGEPHEHRQPVDKPRCIEGGCEDPMVDDDWHCAHHMVVSDDARSKT